MRNFQRFPTSRPYVSPLVTCQVNLKTVPKIERTEKQLSFHQPFFWSSQNIAWRQLCWLIPCNLARPELDWWWIKCWCLSWKKRCSTINITYFCLMLWLYFELKFNRSQMFAFHWGIKIENTKTVFPSQTRFRSRDRRSVVVVFGLVGRDRKRDPKRCFAHTV